VIDPALAARLHRQANGDRWRLPIARFLVALEASAKRAFAGRTPAREDVDGYLSALHLADLALACACAEGSEIAWEHFVYEYRPALYRAADALAPQGAARELADSLYGDLFGLAIREGERQSLFRYFHGRSSLAAWLRAVLAQRFVDRWRSDRRTEPVPEDDSPAALASPPPAIDPDRERLLARVRHAFAQAVAALPAEDRLRLGCYYADELTLAQTGRVLREHEATVSRQLARTRKAIRLDVEQQLGAVGLGHAEIAQGFEHLANDAGPLDLARLLDPDAERKKIDRDRSLK
jgi:RNA polymerase sigma-70 factor (ECF subfamily)